MDFLVKSFISERLFFMIMQVVERSRESQSNSSDG